MVRANSHQVWLNLWVPVEEFCDNWQAPLPCFHSLDTAIYCTLQAVPTSTSCSLTTSSGANTCSHYMQYHIKTKKYAINACCVLFEWTFAIANQSANIYMYSTYMHYTVWSNCYLVPIHTKEDVEKIDCIQCSAVHFIFGDCWSAILGSVKYLLIKHNLLPLPTTMTADPPGLCSLAGWDRGWKRLETSQSWQALTHQTSDRQWLQNNDKG